MWTFLPIFLRVTGRQSNRTDSRQAAFKEVKRAGTEAANQRDAGTGEPPWQAGHRTEADWKVYGNEPMDEKTN